MKSITKALILFVCLVGVCSFISFSCDADYTNAPFAAAISCLGDGAEFETSVDSIFATARMAAQVTVPANTQFEGVVANPGFQPGNGITTTVIFLGSSTGGGFLQDPFTGITLPDEFFTPTNKDGFIFIDLSCAAPPLIPGEDTDNICRVQFIIGGIDTQRCEVEMTVTTLGSLLPAPTPDPTP